MRAAAADAPIEWTKNCIRLDAVDRMAGDLIDGDGLDEQTPLAILREIAAEIGLDA